MPRFRPPTAAEMAVTNALQYEYIGGGGPPVVPTGKPRRPKAPPGPAYVHLLVDDPDGTPSIRCAYLTVEAATQAAKSTRDADSELPAVLTVPLLDGSPPPQP